MTVLLFRDAESGVENSPSIGATIADHLQRTVHRPETQFDEILELLSWAGRSRHSTKSPQAEKPLA
jgi:hypothetical protein